MQMSGSELLIYGLLIAAFLLFNFLSRQPGKRAGEEQAAAAPDVPVTPAEDAMLEDIWSRTPAAAPSVPEPEERVAPVQRTEALPAAQLKARLSAAPRRLFRTRQDLRQAIVVMTVLGPCRALEPPGDPWGRPPTNGGRPR